MQYTILLKKDEDTHKIEAQEKARFIRFILDALNVPVEFNPEIPLTAESKIQYKKSLEKFKLSVIDNGNGGLDIYAANDIIAQWKKPKYVLKEDRAKLDPKERLYLEMTVEFTSEFEGESK